MDEIIKALRDGRLIDAVKTFRTKYRDHHGQTYGLKDAKDAVEAIRNAMGIMRPSECIVVSRRSPHEEFYVNSFSTKLSAMEHADDLVRCRSELYVAQIVAKSETVTTRVLKAVS
jgi:hypothetical protein